MVDLTGFDAKTLDEQIDVLWDVCCMDGFTAVSKENLIFLLRWLVGMLIRCSAAELYKDDRRKVNQDM